MNFIIEGKDNLTCPLHKQKQEGYKRKLRREKGVVASEVIGSNYLQVRPL